MISTKKLIRIARKWREMASIGRKRISLRRVNEGFDADKCNESSMADKTHFVIYTTGKMGLVIPLSYLSNDIFRELLKTSEDEFELPSDGPITLPRDSAFMDYIVLLVGRRLAKDLEKALINSVTSRCFLAGSSHNGYTGQQSLVSGY